MSTRRVAVTGLGVICARGNNTSETWNAVCEGRSGIAPIHDYTPTQARHQGPFSQSAGVSVIPESFTASRQ